MQAKDALALFPKQFLDAHKVCLQRFEKDKATAIALAQFQMECALAFLQVGFQTKEATIPNVEVRDLDLCYSMASDFSVGSVDTPNIPLHIYRRYIELLWNWLQKLRWFNEFAHGSLNGMAWLKSCGIFTTCVVFA